MVPHNLLLADRHLRAQHPVFHTRASLLEQPVCACLTTI